MAKTIPSFERKIEFRGPGVKRVLASTGTVLLLCGGLALTGPAELIAGDAELASSNAATINSAAEAQSEPSPHTGSHGRQFNIRGRCPRATPVARVARIARFTRLHFTRPIVFSGS